MNRLTRLLTAITVLAITILTSSDVTTLVLLALHLPPILALAAVVVIGAALLVRSGWRHWGERVAGAHGLAGVAALLLAVMVYPQIADIWPLWSWIRLGLPALWATVIGR